MLFLKKRKPLFLEARLWEEIISILKFYSYYHLKSRNIPTLIQELCSVQRSLFQVSQPNTTLINRNTVNRATEKEIKPPNIILENCSSRLFILFSLIRFRSTDKICQTNPVAFCHRFDLMEKM